MIRATLYSWHAKPLFNLVRLVDWFEIGESSLEVVSTNLMLFYVSTVRIYQGFRDRKSIKFVDMA